MPVGRGSIARATSASNSKVTASVKDTKQMPNILTNIPLEQIEAVPKAWLEGNKKNQSIAELKASIEKYGIIEPVILRRINDGQFQLLSGYLRLQASREIGMETISARVLDGLNDKEARAIYGDLHTAKVADSVHEDSIHEDSIHEAKFKVVSTMSKDMPAYLL